jgi:flagellar biosynthetic protein FliO
MFVLLCAMTGLAAYENTSGFSPQASYLATSAEPVKYLVKSFFYILLLLGLFYLVKKYFLPQGLSLPGGENLRILRKLPLEVQVAVYVVQAGDSFLLLGVGGKQISLLKELTAQEAEVFSVQPSPGQTLEPFKNYLKTFLVKKK